MKKAKTESTLCLAIDPGDKESGFVWFRPDHSKPGGISLGVFGKMPNRALRRIIHQDKAKLVDSGLMGMLCIEMPRARGMPTANEEFQACVEIGRFLQTWGGKNWSYVFRGEVKVEICGSAKAKDPHIRQALIDMWGGEDEAIGGKRCKKCHGKGWVGRDHNKCPACKGSTWDIPPGPLNGVSKDTWAALAIAVAWSKTQEVKHDLKPSKAKRPVMACDRCKVKKCQCRGDEYNIGCTPGIDCLAAK